MRKIRCSSCDAKLKLPDSFSGDTVKCPKCGDSFATTSNQSAENAADSDFESPFETEESVAFSTPSEIAEGQKIPPTPSGTDPTSNNPSPTTTHEPIDPNADYTMATAANQANRLANRSSNRNSKKLAIFDFQFKKFWTPLIIQVSWFTILIFAALWIAFFSVAFIGYQFFGQSFSVTDAVALPDVSSLNINDVLNGKADVDSLNKFLDGVEDAGKRGRGSGSSSKSTSGFQSVMMFMFSILSFLTMVVSTILSVLFCRVFFETIIAIFDTSKSLKSIDQKLDDRS